MHAITARSTTCGRSEKSQGGVSRNAAAATEAPDAAPAVAGADETNINEGDDDCIADELRGDAWPVKGRR